MALKDVRILIVEDDLFFRTVLRDTLEKIGFTVVAEAVDGDEAVEMYRVHRPHVTIIDIYLPGTNGIEVTKSILALNNKANILVCSASDDPRDTQAAIQAGAKGTVMKPFIAKELYESIKTILGGK